MLYILYGQRLVSLPTFLKFKFGGKVLLAIYAGKGIISLNIIVCPPETPHLSKGAV